jgi:hypothetical protein
VIAAGLNSFSPRLSVLAVLVLLTAVRPGLCQNAVSHGAPLSCASCHRAESAAQPTSPMGRAMEAVGDCGILKAHPLLTFQTGKYSYRIERKGNQSVYSVTDGVQTITVPIGWAFGLGQAGQTYVFEKDGRLYESQVSYYKVIDGLDLTMGAINHPPLDLLQAAGREMGKQDSAQCFQCHATNSGEGLNLNLASTIPGITCERCHSSAASHMAGLQSGHPVVVKKLTDGSAEQVNTFCGSCHRTWDEIATGPRLGVASVRFQAYRITNSKCYDSDDARISCVNCHDPHQALNRDEASYDRKCLACHSEGGKATARLCKVSQNNCASCHMPQIEMPGSHHSFTDHQIRIVRLNDPFPE